MRLDSIDPRLLDAVIEECAQAAEREIDNMRVNASDKDLRTVKHRVAVAIRALASSAQTDGGDK